MPPFDRLASHTLHSSCSNRNSLCAPTNQSKRKRMMSVCLNLSLPKRYSPAENDHTVCPTDPIRNSTVLLVMSSFAWQSRHRPTLAMFSPIPRAVLKQQQKKANERGNPVTIPRTSANAGQFTNYKKEEEKKKTSPACQEPSIVLTWVITQHFLWLSRTVCWGSVQRSVSSSFLFLVVRVCLAVSVVPAAHQRICPIVRFLDLYIETKKHLLARAILYTYKWFNGNICFSSQLL